MRFLQKDNMYKIDIVSSFSLLCFFLWIIFIKKITHILVIICCIGTFVSVIENIFEKKKYIVMDNQGIRCEIGPEILWSFSWNEIEYLRKTSIYHARAIEIILTEDRTNGKELLSEKTLYFMYGKKAKEALDEYCRCEIRK